MVNRLLSTGAALAWLGGLAKAEVSFEKHVQPVLASACLSCHGEKKDKGELRLHTLEDLLKGGENGKVIVSAATTWAMLDRKTNRLVRVRPEVLATFTA